MSSKGPWYYEAQLVCAHLFGLRMPKWPIATTGASVGGHEWGMVEQQWADSQGIGINA